MPRATVAQALVAWLAERGVDAGDVAVLDPASGPPLR